MLGGLVRKGLRPRRQLSAYPPDYLRGYVQYEGLTGLTPTAFRRHDELELFPVPTWAQVARGALWLRGRIFYFAFVQVSICA